MKKSVKVLVVFTFIAMVVVNILATSLPINGIDTGAVSDSYPNLFAPSGITFSIWGVIYILLLGYTFYQLGIINKKDDIKNSLLNKVGIIFSVSSIANTLWIFTWHYRIIYLSLILMIVIFISLLMIVNTIKNEKLTNKEKFFVKLPFSVYFGWITVALIANATTFLVSIGWNGFGLSDYFWTTAIVSVGAIIGIFTIIKNKDYPYGLVLVWAYLGILIKHTSQNFFNSMYPAVIAAVIISLALFIASDIYVIVKKKH